MIVLVPAEQIHSALMQRDRVCFLFTLASSAEISIESSVQLLTVILWALEQRQDHVWPSLITITLPYCCVGVHRKWSVNLIWMRCQSAHLMLWLASTSTKAVSEGVRKSRLLPWAPIRAVRPTRWTYSAAEMGGLYCKKNKDIHFKKWRTGNSNQVQF